MLRAALGVIQEGTSPTPVAEEPEPRSAPIALPPVLDGEPMPVKEEIGWAREDTKEFEPIAVEPIAPVEAAPIAPVETEPEELHAQIDEHEHEPEQEQEHRSDRSVNSSQPVLQSVPGRESRDFDWGE